MPNPKRSGTAHRASRKLQGASLIARQPERRQAGDLDLGTTSSADLISLALESARRMLGSSEPNSKVMSRLQCWQLT
jgi:hypothetical protein